MFIFYLLAILSLSFLGIFFVLFIVLTCKATLQLPPPRASYTKILYPPPLYPPPQPPSPHLTPILCNFFSLVPTFFRTFCLLLGLFLSCSTLSTSPFCVFVRYLLFTCNVIKQFFTSPGSKQCYEQNIQYIVLYILQTQN